MKPKNKKNAKANEIPYADKYLYGDNYSDKFDSLRHGHKRNDVEKAHRTKTGRYALLALSCVLLFCTGFFLMCIAMEQNARPVVPSVPIQQENPNENRLPTIGDATVALNAKLIASDHLDGGAMLDSLIKEATSSGYNAVLFDLKRQDGTLAYQSTLTTASTYNAVASPGAKVKESIATLLQNNIVPLARIYCFEDKTAASFDTGLAVQNTAGAVWTDKQGNTWLNPYAQGAQDYLSSIILEVQSLGISTILLDSVSYPTGDHGSMVFRDSVVGNPDPAKLNDFVASVRTKLGTNARLLVAQNMTLTTQEELSSALSTYKESKGNVPVLTISLPPTTVINALAQANISNYIYIAVEPPPVTVTTTTTEMEN